VLSPVISSLWMLQWLSSRHLSLVGTSACLSYEYYNYTKLTPIISNVDQTFHGGLM